jgi:hypothetical protein
MRRILPANQSAPARSELKIFAETADDIGAFVAVLADCRRIAGAELQPAGAVFATRHRQQVLAIIAKHKLPYTYIIYPVRD